MSCLFKDSQFSFYVIEFPSQTRLLAKACLYFPSPGSKRKESAFFCFPFLGPGIVTDPRRLIDDIEQSKRCLGELEHLFLTVNSYGKPLLNLALCMLPLSIDLSFNGFKTAARIPLDAKPFTFFPTSHLD